MKLIEFFGNENWYLPDRSYPFRTHVQTVYYFPIQLGKVPRSTKEDHDFLKLQPTLHPIIFLSAMLLANAGASSDIWESVMIEEYKDYIAREVL